MPTEYASSLIAEELAKLWNLSQLPQFADYVWRTYLVNITTPPNFRCLFIGETEDGDINRGPVGGLIKGWWVVDHQGFRPIQIPKMDWETDSAFVATPVILFFRQGERISLCERLGQRIVCWKSGSYQFADGRATIFNLQLLDV